MRVLALCLLLAGCATAPTDNPDASYFLVSKGGASGIVQFLSGGVQYCKVTQKNLGGTDFDVKVKYDSEDCVVEARTRDK